jgi:hypothetical protein
MFKFPLFKKHIIQPDLLEIDSLIERLNGCQEYKTAEPYPHIVLDNALNSQELRTIF